MVLVHLTNHVVYDNIYNIISKYNDKYQIQDFLDIKYIHSINCLCKNGNIISSLDFIYFGFIDRQFYDKNIRTIFEIPNKNI